MTALPVSSKCAFVHYSCDDFRISERVFVVGARIDGKAHVWPATSEEQEIEAIRNLYEFLVANSDRVIINWKMDEYQFGPDHLARRYRQLSGMDLPELKNEWLNLSNYLWEKYGEYAPHPRLRNLCEMNEILLYGHHVDPDNYNKHQAKIHKVVTHTSAVERIHYKELRGTLRICSTPIQKNLIVTPDIIAKPVQHQSVSTLQDSCVETKSIVFKYEGKYYSRNEEGHLLETFNITEAEVFTIVTSGEDIPFDTKGKFAVAYGQYQSLKARYHYNEINIDLKLVSSPSQVLPFLRRKHEGILMLFKAAPHWQGAMRNTPRSNAWRAVYEIDAPNWPTFIIKLINRADRIEAAYCYWLILRWLKVLIVKYERSEQKNIPSAATGGQNSSLVQKKVRSDAQDRKDRVLKRYNALRTNGRDHNSALMTLTVEFKLEYSKGNPKGCRSQIQRIIRTQNS